MTGRAVESAPPTVESAPTNIWTVGHGTRSLTELVALLTATGIDVLVDVRRFPRSRHNPQMSRESLTAGLVAADIGYEWRGEELGGRRRLVPGDQSGAGRNSAWRNAAFRAYADYMGTEAFHHGLRELEGTAADGRRLVVMCAETLWWRCHRRLIADALTVHGFTVRHLLDHPPGILHPLHPSMRIEPDGRLSYDAGVGR